MTQIIIDIEKTHNTILNTSAKLAEKLQDLVNNIDELSNEEYESKFKRLKDTSIVLHKISSIHHKTCREILKETKQNEEESLENSSEELKREFFKEKEGLRNNPNKEFKINYNSSTNKLDLTSQKTYCFNSSSGVEL
ncbi:MAG: hypothetical protein J0H68_06110 [Sphingobacteriia bacterium]|nr:hypothetical protein [Sphingobacteriia bacterium]